MRVEFRHQLERDSRKIKGDSREGDNQIIESDPRVHFLQEKKQEIMKQLKEDLRKLDDPEHTWEKQEGERKVEFRDGKYIVEIAGKEFGATVGELLTDHVWGVDYFFDPETVPRNTRKEYIIEKAKYELGRLLDEQITVQETEHSELHYHRKKALEIRLETRDQKNAGKQAEKMVENFFRKIEIDFGAEF